MAISREDVLHIATLARLRLDDEEVGRHCETLSAILEYVEKLEELDTTDVEPTTHAIPLVIRSRDDEVEQRLERDDILGNAPDVVDEQFRVPKVVED